MTQKFTRTARDVALGSLQDVFVEGAYANISLSRRLNEASLTPVERRFATELVYGSVKAVGTIDWILGHYTRQPLSKTDPLVLNILRLGIYQLFFLDRVPASAAVNESVNMARQYGHPGAPGFVNAVLRTAVREPGRIIYPDLEQDPVGHISLKELHPEWLVRRWLAVLGRQETQDLCRFDNAQPPLSLRTHTLRTRREDLLELLAEAGVEAEASALVPEGILCSRLAPQEPLSFIQQGLCQVQDESSMLVGHVVGPLPGEFVIDACAAPGGKATHLATLMGDCGRVLAVDIHAHKIGLIEENVRRLGLNIIEPLLLDSAELHLRYAGTADRVLVDAPCSGLGVLRRRPDARWRKENTLKSLPALQSKILDSAAQCLKPGGILVYSTCTLEDAENSDIVKRFLNSRPEFSLESAGARFPSPRPESMVTLWPQRDGVDGFFIARLRKNTEAGA